MQQIEIFVILGHFLLFQPPGNPENQNFKIETNTWRHYHFTHLHQWQYYDVGFLRYGVQQTEIFVTLDRFCPFTTLWTQKSKILKKWKNTWRYYHFTNINDSHMMHGSSDMECNRQNFLSFWTVFCPFTL